MKIIKYITLLFLLLLLAFVVFVGTQPATYNISMSKEIHTKPETIFNFVTDYSNWNDWQKFDDSENLKFKISENPLGVNAFVKWDDMLLQTKYLSEKSDSLVQNYVDGKNKQSIHWKFKPSNKGTDVVINIRGGLTFKEKIFSVLNGGITAYIRPLLEESLNSIDNYLVNELGTYEVKVKGIINHPETNYLERRDSCLSKDFIKKSNLLLQSMKTFIKNNDIITLGKPFVIFHTEPTKKSMTYSICVPVREEILTTPESQIKGNKFESYLAVKSVLKGNYSHMKNAWIKNREFIRKMKFTEDVNNIYMGVYKTSIADTKQPSKWITEIHIPIVKKKPKPKIKRDTTKINTSDFPTDILQDN